MEKSDFYHNDKQTAQLDLLSHATFQYLFKMVALFYTTRYFHVCLYKMSKYMYLYDSTDNIDIQTYMYLWQLCVNMGQDGVACCFFGPTIYYRALPLHIYIYIYTTYIWSIIHILPWLNMYKIHVHEITYIYIWNIHKRTIYIQIYTMIHVYLVSVVSIGQ